MDDYGILVAYEAVITRFPETVTYRGLDLLDGVEECEACHVGLELVDG
jgi:cytochrome c peroxidase